MRIWGDLIVASHYVHDPVQIEAQFSRRSLSGVILHNDSPGS
jgi:hypothetical protein